MTAVDEDKIWENPKNIAVTAMLMSIFQEPPAWSNIFENEIFLQRKGQQWDKEHCNVSHHAAVNYVWTIISD